MEESPVRPNHVVLGEDTARRILARSIELDHLTSDGVGAADLREAAGEVGISPTAFDAALSESIAEMSRIGPIATRAIPNPTHAARVLHRVLLGGLSTISAVFLFLTFGVHEAPLITAGDGVSMIGYALAACGLVPIVLAIMVLKPRVPERSSGQSDAAFWQTAFYPVIAVWTVFEGAGIIGAVGALLTCLWAPTAVVAIAMTGLLMLRPSYFEND